MGKYLIPVIAAFGGGVTVGSAAAAFITILQIMPRLIKISESNEYIKVYQYMIIASFILFTIIYFSDFHLSLSKHTTIPMGFVCGIFIGMVSSALAEVLNVIPVLSKKLKIKDNLKYIIWTLMLGKVAGSLYFWIFIK
ncbi:stage V sporulation protein AB [Tissierella sp.]|uniref:stage V sporulation protein AB n=1 Tax=Tissierella sp. TaxID=41274 RepID=UPI0028631D5F|nr:stage V sporulation protein AB [Tissierella sp.]MDR7857148.1 stage V sporulation protein AB [Tissierella sp.]